MLSRKQSGIYTIHKRTTDISKFKYNNLPTSQPAEVEMESIAAAWFSAFLC